MTIYRILWRVVKVAMDLKFSLVNMYSSTELWHAYKNCLCMSHILMTRFYYSDCNLLHARRFSARDQRPAAWHYSVLEDEDDSASTIISMSDP